MKKYHEVLGVILFVLVSVNCECDGLLECLKLFIIGDSLDSKSESQVFDLNYTDGDIVKLKDDQSFGGGKYDIFQQANKFIDFFTNAFNSDNILQNNITNNEVFIQTNWSYISISNGVSNLTLLNDTNMITDRIHTYPNVYNATVNKQLNKNYQKSLTKGLNQNELAENFDYEFYDTNIGDNSSDYSVIDYITLYQDTTNEIIETSTTLNDDVNQNTDSIFKTTESNENIIFEHNLDESLKTKASNETHSEFYLMTSLNEVLNDFENKDDGFTDYPFVDYIDLYPDISIQTESTTTENTATEVTTDGFYVLGLAEEAVNLCKTRSAITMDHVVGLPVDQENYWDGEFLSRSYKGLKRVELFLELTTAVTITTDSDNVITTRLNDTTFLIKGLNVSERVTFKVQALPGQSFPFVKKVTLNGREICKRKRPWKPSLFGKAEQAVVSPLESPHEFGPYFCGRSKIDFSPLVVKGVPTKEGDYPWHVAIFIKNLETEYWDFACGGTIMTHKTIITAAHCVVNRDSVHIPKERLLIVAGKYRLHEVDKNQKILTIEKIVVHENYTQAGNTLAHDLALLITEDSIEYGMYVQPICHWNKKQEDREVIFQEFGTVVGWGVTENETLAETLLAASMRAVPDSICLKSRPSFFKRYLTMNTFCAGNRNGTSACNGDSGGGLIFPITELDGRQSWYLRGVVSAGVRRAGGLCDPTHYVVFTDVVRYRQWIEENQQL